MNRLENVTTLATTYDKKYMHGTEHVNMAENYTQASNDTLHVKMLIVSV